MRRKIFTSMCLLAILSVLVTTVALSFLMYRELHNATEREVVLEAAYLSEGLRVGGREYLEQMMAAAGEERLTWIGADGTVLFDNTSDIAAMDNHLSRPEVQAALQNGFGTEVRHSETIQKQILYYAVLQKDGSILRVAKYTDNILGMVLSNVPYMLLISVAVASCAMLLAKHQTKRIIIPINDLNLEDPLSQNVYEELSPLMLRISRQNSSIEDGMHALREQQEEFLAITENMNEGLIVLDNRGTVLSINGMAKRVFGVTDEDCTQCSILRINRGEAVRQVVHTALDGQRGEGILTLGGRHYNLFSNPVYVEEQPNGVILLLIDVTERQEAERLRREFSANVSHELKTPLQSISGYAEILKNGMVGTADVPRFSERIYQEASRLIKLVEDIIELSRLDENSEAHPKEWVELKEIVNGVAERLEEVASRKEVKIQVTGEAGKILGSRGILEEMIYNLCENGIKYNKFGGNVEIHIGSDERKTFLYVKDSGIGIPEESQQRVFERFYRVDKSRSKGTGGTGLGLSIVKHGALFHKADLILISQPDEGTKITVAFPKTEEYTEDN